MTAETNAGWSADDPTRTLLAHVARIHPFALLADDRAQVLWVSADWARCCEDPAKCLGRDLYEQIPDLPNPEESRAWLSELRRRGVLLRATVDLPDGRDGTIPTDLSILPVELRADASTKYLVVARPAADRRPPEPQGTLLLSAPEALVAIDAGGFVESANPAAERLLGVGPGALAGAPLAALATRAEEIAELLEALAGREARTVEVSLRRPGREPLAARVTIAPHRREDGGLDGAVASLRAAEASQASAGLTRRVEELESCINTLAHDLRSPLVALLGFSRLLRQDYCDRLDETGLHFLDRIELAGRTMEGLIHDLLELSRIGQPGENATLVDPRLVLLQLAAELKPRLEGRDIALELPEAPPLLTCDRTRLYQLFSNLIGNAIDHMGDCAERRIQVAVRTEERAHHLCVRDFGAGIAAEHHERIFDVFQTAAARSGSTRGTGIGLAIVRKIADTHGGRAWVESRPGEGAAFHVTLPRR